MRDPRRAGVPREPDPGRAGSRRLPRAFLNNTSLYPAAESIVSGVTGNFVGPSAHDDLRAHQGDFRIDWSASTRTRSSDGSRSRSSSRDSDMRAMPLLLGSSSRLAVPEPRVQLEPHLQAHRSSTRCSSASTRSRSSTIRSTWASIGNANATFGIGGGQPIPGLSSIGLGSGLTGVGAGATDTDTLDKTYQINEKLTWMTGRQTIKFGGQMLHYVQRASTPATMACSGSSATAAPLPTLPFSDFLLDQVARARGAAARRSRGRTCTIGRALRAGRFQGRPALTLNLGMRWAYTQPVVEKDNRQSNFDLTTGQQILAEDEQPRRAARFIRPIRRGSNRASASRTGPRTTGSCAARMASRSTWREPAPTCGCR